MTGVHKRFHAYITITAVTYLIEDFYNNAWTLGPRVQRVNLLAFNLTPLIWQAAIGHIIV